ncbi:class I SAM-dependent methyltransferase [Candidatus Falkowbacteria bacterium]|nr:class I SAM-dependent methyltransferase [Candidatus Falkowbacteria bacterium]
MFKKYLNRHTDLDSSQKAWEYSWCRQSFGAARIIDLGRRVYNYFLLRFLKKYINNQIELLEFGCGTATLGIMLAKNIKSYTGFDIAGNALKEAEENFRKNGLQNFSFEVKDITNFDYDKKFDLVWSQGLIEHFQQPYKLIDAHLKVCKDGGAVIISVPAYHSYHYIWYLLTRSKWLRRFWPWPDVIFISEKMFNEYMDRLENSYSQYKITHLKPKILGLSILVIKK